MPGLQNRLQNIADCKCLDCKIGSGLHFGSCKLSWIALQRLRIGCKRIATTGSGLQLDKLWMTTCCGWHSDGSGLHMSSCQTPCHSKHNYSTTSFGYSSGSATACAVQVVAFLGYVTFYEIELGQPRVFRTQGCFVLLGYIADNYPDGMHVSVVILHSIGCPRTTALLHSYELNCVTGCAGSQACSAVQTMGAY